MATPCSAPFLGTALGFALGQPAGTVFAAFTAIALGMALPYLALAAFPAAVRLVPRPGPWMDRLKTVMGFLLAAAAVWLFYVLAAQLSRERLAFVQLAVLAMALCVWWARVAGRSWRKLAAAGAVAAAVATLALAAGGAPRAAAATGGGLIDWLAWDRVEAEGLAAEGRLVFVDVTADWCFTCKVNERLALETAEVAAAFERLQVVAMKADWTNRDDAITDFLADHGRYGIPFYLLYRPGPRAPPVLRADHQGDRRRGARGSGGPLAPALAASRRRCLKMWGLPTEGTTGKVGLASSIRYTSIERPPGGRLRGPGPAIATGCGLRAAPTPERRGDGEPGQGGGAGLKLATASSRSKSIEGDTVMSHPSPLRKATHAIPVAALSLLLLTAGMCGQVDEGAPAKSSELAGGGAAGARSGPGEKRRRGRRRGRGGGTARRRERRGG